jgi:GT2 family glycosyltransferase
VKNTRVFSSILLSNDIYPEFAWRGRYNEDVDLSIRVLKAGYATLLFNSLTANKATTMTCKGGNTDTIYSVEDAHLKKSKELETAHPDVVKVTTRYGRIHHLANLNKFKDNAFIWKLSKSGHKIVSKRKNREYNLVLENL